MDAVENNDKSYFDPILAPRDQVERYLKANYPDHVKNAIETLVVDYQIKLRVILDKLESHEITSELIDEINDTKLLNAKNYKLYEKLNISPRDISLKGLEAINKYIESTQYMDKNVNESQEPKYTTIVKDDNVANKNYKPTIGEVKSDYFPHKTNTEYVELESDLFPKSSRKKQYEAARSASVTGKPPQKYKKSRKKIRTTIISLSLIACLGIAAYASKDKGNDKDIETAQRMIDNAESYTQSMNDLEIDDYDEYAGLIGPEKKKAQQQHLMNIAIAESDPTPKELLEYIDDPEYTEGKTDDINTVIKNIASYDSRISGNIYEGNDYGHLSGKWKQETLNDLRKGAK